jgi:hypothetical protein
MLQGVPFAETYLCLLALGPFHGEAQAKGPSGIKPFAAVPLVPFAQGLGNASLQCSLVRLRELQKHDPRRAGLKPGLYRICESDEPIASLFAAKMDMHTVADQAALRHNARGTLSRETLIE